MNKKQLIREVARRTGFSIRLSSMIVKFYTQTIISELKQGHRISLKDFGAFCIVKRHGKTYFDFRDSKIKKSPATKSVKFIPYKNFKKQLCHIDIHSINDGSLENTITLGPRIFTNPQPKHRERNSNISSPNYGKQNIGERTIHKQDALASVLVFNGKFFYDKFQGELDHTIFPSINIPQRNTSILVPQPDKTGATIGIMEPVLLSSLHKVCKDFSCIKIIGNVKLPILNRNYSYRPDICLFWEEKNLYIDIEVDEPYDIVSRKPIHYKGNGDNLRDRYFIRNGWCVIRFTEQQVHDNIEGVTNYIKRMLRWLTNDERIRYNEDTLSYVKRWSYDQAEQMASDNTRERYLGLPDYDSTKYTQMNIVSNNLNSGNVVFSKPDEDILPAIKESKWASVINEIAKSNCDYCKVFRKNGYQWVYNNRQMRIISQNGKECITGNSPLGYELEISVDEIADLVPLEDLFSKIHWESHSNMQIEDFHKMIEILFDAIANGNPIWIAYDSKNSGYGTRFLSNLVYYWKEATYDAPHIGLGHCAKYGFDSLSHFYAYCSNRKEFRMFAADGRLKSLKVLNCDHVYIANKVYERSFAKLIMSLYDNGNAFFENADKILEYMPVNEHDSSITQVNLADLHVLKGNPNKAIELYEQKPYGYFLTPYCTWGEACIDDIKFFINLFNGHLDDNHDYYNFNAKAQILNFEKVLEKLAQSSWMRRK